MRLLGTLLLLAAAPCIAQDGGPAPLTPGRVLESSGIHFPSILESLAERRALEGRSLEADGAFDLVFSADGFSRATGYYDGTVLGGTARQPLRTMGASVYAGYRLSDGDFPVYEDQYYTNSGGELAVGLLFSLLRDRDIDEERFGITDAELALREADQDVLMTRIGVQRRALVAYWRWVTAGRALEVYRNLLRIAEERESALARQVERGARAEIFLVENSQNVTRRRTLTTSAARDLERAANELSYYYRTADGQPLMPEAPEIPPAPPVTEPIDLSLPPQSGASDALLRRPELLKLRATIDRVRNKVALAENDLQPRLDLSVGVDHDFGGIAEGGPSRDATDTKVGVTFSVPLQRRQARGKLYSAESELDALRQQQRRKQDEIEIEVRNILISLQAANELLRLAREQVLLTEQMRDAEQRRFESGASDFFLVNIREETAADARIQYHMARLEREVALADYHAATVDLPRLGIED